MPLSWCTGWKRGICFGSVVKRSGTIRVLHSTITRKHVPRTRLVYNPRNANGLTITVTCTHCLYYSRHGNRSTYNRYPSYGGFSGLMRPSLRFTFPVCGGSSGGAPHDSSFVSG